ncbi:hypothetical protein BAZSYMA_ACONTIG03627_0 [Bathymodiolus azoricus thioautotrophic gill symbiont]|uniref:Uncharacterized protein n=1 Tax=Bathymodiolus azoricus thioautotrophic gill symbiont TaxID=235205 RepID=A0A1H6K3Y5_9GAMM|nr:hypothetical protein BAZSYMA_ACONTIG03627_0 [Bathymodiolus azoricus thioautotrophic gill symbiont]
MAPLFPLPAENSAAISNLNLLLSSLWVLCADSMVNSLASTFNESASTCVPIKFALFLALTVKFLLLIDPPVTVVILMSFLILVTLSPKLP